MPSPFVIKDVKYALLTYSQVPAEFSYNGIVLRLRELGASCSIGREHHRDGGLHFHAFASFERPFSTRNGRKFDVDGHHPNIAKVGRTPWLAYDYCRKDGEIVHDEVDRPAEETAGRHNQSAASWEHVLQAPTKEDFFSRLRLHFPRVLVASYTQVCKYAEATYKRAPEPYRNPDDHTFSTGFYGDLEQWRDNMQLRTTHSR